MLINNDIWGNQCVPYTTNNLYQIETKFDKYVRYVNIVNVVFFCENLVSCCLNNCKAHQHQVASNHWAKMTYGVYRFLLNVSVNKLCELI